MRLLLAALALVVCTGLVEAKTYGNARFSYFVNVPEVVGFHQFDSQNGDGAVFQSSDNSAQLLVYGGWLSDASFAQSFTLRIVYEKDDGWRITYQKLKGAAFGVYSGRRGKRIVYGRIIPTCDGHATANFRLEYPMADKMKYDSVIAKLSASLKAGAGGC